MKLKSLPTDFKVCELTEFTTSGGPFALYRLSKSSIGTPEAIQAVLRNWNLSRTQVSYGGLKDRHAQTTQFVTIHQGPRQDLVDRSFRLEYVGQAPRRFDAKDIDGNRFDITLRGIQSTQRSVIDDRLQLIQKFGVVNYFDDQRFGSLGSSGRFIAEPWCKGDYEQALYLALAEPNSHDRGREQSQKQILRDYWGQWVECKDRLDRSHRRSIVTFLCDHPTNFKRAVALIRSDLRSLYLAAFQSGLWNRWLSRLIHSRSDIASTEFDSAIGPLAIPAIANSRPEAIEWLTGLSLPLPTARQHDWPEDLVPVLDEVLAEFQMERREIRLKYPRDTFFSKGVRHCWLKPRDFRFSWLNDELHAGQSALQLQFDLPRGAYATMVVKILDLNKFVVEEEEEEQ